MLDAIQLAVKQKLPYAGCHTVGSKQLYLILDAIQLTLIDNLPYPGCYTVGSKTEATLCWMPYS